MESKESHVIVLIEYLAEDLHNKLNQMRLLINDEDINSDYDEMRLLLSQIDDMMRSLMITSQVSLKP